MHSIPEKRRVGQCLLSLPFNTLLDGLSTIAHSLANNSVFVKLAIPGRFIRFTTVIHLSQEVNEARERNELPPIEFEGEYCMC